MIDSKLKINVMTLKYTDYLMLRSDSWGCARPEYKHGFPKVKPMLFVTTLQYYWHSVNVFKCKINVCSNCRLLGITGINGSAVEVFYSMFLNSNDN